MTPREKRLAIDRTVQFEGRAYRIVGLGVEREDGTIYAHLAAVTEGSQQKNGFVPRQFSDFIPLAVVQEQK